MAEQLVDDEPFEEQMEDTEKAPRIGPHNVLNALGWLVMTTITLVAVFTDSFGKKLEDALAGRSLLSPFSEIQMLWVVVFAFELLFVLAQFAELHRQSERVRLASPWFILTSIAHTAWIVTICLDVDIFVSTMALAIASVSMLILILRAEILGKRTFFQYWFLRAPFSIHAGFLFCLFVSEANAILQERMAEKSYIVVSTAMTSLTAILSLTTFFALAIPRPDGFFCSAVTAVMYGIGAELQDLENLDFTDEVRKMLTDDVITAFHYGAWGIAFASACLATLAFLLRIFWCCSKVD